jgi:hypothetical protein
MWQVSSRTANFSSTRLPAAILIKPLSELVFRSFQPRGTILALGVKENKGRKSSLTASAGR